MDEKGKVVGFLGRTKGGPEVGVTNLQPDQWAQL